MSLDDVAKVTKIQPRILERLEAGKLDGLPAEVFVRGFVRSFARCVGLDDGEALRRYAACGLGAASPDLTPTVRALVEVMADLAPGSATAARATPRKMLAIEMPGVTEARGVREVPGVIDLATRPTSSVVVETMLLPETGTLMRPLPPAASVAEAMTDPGSVAASLAASALATADPGAGSPAPPAACAVDAVGSVGPVGPVDAGEPALLGGGSAGSSIIVASSVVSNVVSGVVSGPGPGGAVASGEPSGRADQPASKKKRGRRRKARASAPSTSESCAGGVARQAHATGTPPAASPIVTAIAAEAQAPVAASPAAGSTAPIASPATADGGSAAVDRSSSPGTSDTPRQDQTTITEEPGEAAVTWEPRMPPIASAPSVPWRRPAHSAMAAMVAVPVVPSLVIDDADPDSAERMLEERAENQGPRRSFLPPILLDREDRSARQGGLTLAVILLLIAATLTLSYLMRRPSASGDGMTLREMPVSRLG